MKLSLAGYTPLSILRGLVIILFVWPVLVVMGIRLWLIKRGTMKRTTIEGGMGILLTLYSIPVTIVLYVALVILYLM